MRVLFLSPELPFPAESGGTIKSLSLLEYLRARHEVHLLCFRRGPLTPEQARWRAEMAPVDSVPLERGRTPANLLRSYLAGLPLSVYRNHSREMADLAAARLRGGDIDAVFVDGWLMAQYLPPGFKGLALLHEHNAEHLLWLRQARRERNPALKLALYAEHWRVRRYESAVLPRFQTVFAVSEEDRRSLIELGALPERVDVLPNLPDQALLERPALSFEAGQPVILYFGTLSWQPNIEGLRYFLRSVFPLLRLRVHDVRFVIAGRGAPGSLERLARRTPGVEFLGPVADAEPLYRRARLFVEASRSGGGTRLKVLNALARGLPVVSTPQGAAGLELVPGEHLLVAETPEEMASAAARLLSDAALWRRLSENGRALVRQRHRPEVAYRPLDELLCGASAPA